MIEYIKNWKFMNEGAGQWFLFVIAMTLILVAWGKILGYMREAISEV